MGVERLPTLGEGTAHLPNQYEPSAGDLRGWDGFVGDFW